MTNEKEKPTTENYVRVHLDGKGKIKSMETNCDYYELGLHFYEKEDWESALYCFNEVIESESNHPEAYIYIKRGNCYLHLRNFEKFFEDFDMAMKFNHDYNENHLLGFAAKFSESLEYKKLF